MSELSLRQRLPGTAALLIFLTGVAFSQQTRSLRGSVTDETGNVLVGAVVQLQNKSTSQIRSFITQSDGRYRFEELSTDITYEVQADYKGVFGRTKILSKFNSRKLATINLEIHLSSPQSH